MRCIVVIRDSCSLEVPHAGAQTQSAWYYLGRKVALLRFLSAPRASELRLRLLVIGEKRVPTSTQCE